ncbi:glycosyltransferase family 4 protein, partial [Pedobacter sp.]|uniref:glycosyltransferase family 4 protein n=1 Tax=Pedobacter sp. TaxID=1411316 RepID=UPI002C71C6E4
EKNQEMLIKVVQKFNETGEVKCKLLLIGEIQDRPLYMRLIKLAAGDPNIEFKGAQQNIADYLSIADAFCLSSFFEGMPISLIEAMAVGCIPVCTPVGGMKEMISDGLTGFLSEDTRMESYELALKKALYSDQKQALKERIIRHFETHFHIEISAKKHLKTYQQLLDQQEGARSAFALQYESKFK